MNGVHRSPWWPIVGITIWSSMNSTIVSARLRTPVGAFVPSRLPASRKITVLIKVAATAISAILLNVGKMSSQRSRALIGGNSSPNTVVVPSCQWVRGGGGFSPGWARDSATYLSSHIRSPRWVTMMVAPSAGSEIHAASLTIQTARKIRPRRMR